jgi:hypothetical protein
MGGFGRPGPLAIARHVVPLLVLALAFSAASPALSAQPPDVTAYKARVNSICRHETVVLLRYLREMKADQARQDYDAWFRVYTRDVAFAVATNERIVNLEVPPELRERIEPVLRLLHQADQLMAKSYRDSKAGHPTAADREYARALRLAGRIDPVFDAVGLTDCGSKQTKALTGG